jgi:outer membrane protein
MKKVFILTICALGLTAFTGLHAQSKIGYISMEELVTSMPEAKKADTALEKYKEDLQKAQQDMQADLQTRYQKFVVDSPSMTQAKKDLVRKEIQDLLTQVQSSTQDAQAAFQKKQQDLYGPIQQKALDAIQTVAKEGGYGYVMSKENLIVSPPGDDLLPLVKKKLGIK